MLQQINIALLAAVNILQVTNQEFGRAWFRITGVAFALGDQWINRVLGPNRAEHREKEACSCSKSEYGHGDSTLGTGTARILSTYVLLCYPGKPPGPGNGN